MPETPMPRPAYEMDLDPSMEYAVGYQDGIAAERARLRGEVEALPRNYDETGTVFRARVLALLADPAEPEPSE